MSLPGYLEAHPNLATSIIWNAWPSADQLIFFTARNGHPSCSLSRWVAWPSDFWQNEFELLSDRWSDVGPVIADCPVCRWLVIFTVQTAIRTGVLPDFEKCQKDRWNGRKTWHSPSSNLWRLMIAGDYAVFLWRRGRRQRPPVWQKSTAAFTKQSSTPPRDGIGLIKCLLWICRSVAALI